MVVKAIQNGTSSLAVVTFTGNDLYHLPGYIDTFTRIKQYIYQDKTIHFPVSINIIEPSSGSITKMFHISVDLLCNGFTLHWTCLLLDYPSGLGSLKPNPLACNIKC